MDPPSRSPALNPASTPFFPGAMRLSDEDGGGHGHGHGHGHGLGNGNIPLGFRQSIVREHQYSTSSSLSISPSDYRSVRSSPSPPQDDRDRRIDNGPLAPSSAEFSRNSPGFRQSLVDHSDKAPYSHLLSASISRDLNISPKSQGPLDGDETPGPTSGPIPMNGQIAASLYNTMAVRSRERFGTPPVMQDPSSVRSGGFIHPPFVSSSPSSSLDSGSHFGPSLEFAASTNLETQLRASPQFNDLLDRVGRLEGANREIHRTLDDVNRKVDVLIARVLASNSHPALDAPPEFKDPFAPSSGPGQGFVAPALNGPGPRGSMVNIAPNQTPPTEDMTTITSRLNTLASSVGQLLALQTQQLQANNSVLQSTQMMGGGLPPSDLTPGLPPMLNTTAALGHGMPGRPDIRQNPRAPNQPMRTWSAGTLDLPLRTTDSPQGMGRQDMMFRDKRRSVSTLLRRDSAGVSYVSPHPHLPFSAANLQLTFHVLGRELGWWTIARRWPRDNQVGAVESRSGATAFPKHLRVSVSYLV